MKDIAARLSYIRTHFGPDAIAFYAGTMATSSATTSKMLDALRLAIGSRMRFGPATIDKAGKQVAEALHGRWQAPVSGYSDPEVALLLGINPPISYQGAPRGNPALWLRQQSERGMRLLVIDPRNTETARRADVHLQPLPGHDAAMLAAILNVVLAEKLYDEAFVNRHVEGLERLQQTVSRFTPAVVAQIADVRAEDLVEVARVFGASRRGYVSVGTGPNMSGPGSLVEYLAISLDTLCGHVAREGEVVRNAPSLQPASTYRAQMSPPKQGTGFEPFLTASGLTTSAAGPPIAGLPAEITRDDDSRVRALISCGGNPASAWPGQRVVVNALEELDLLVQVDPYMSNTARVADYVIAPTMPLEVADMTQHMDMMTGLSIGYGLADSYAQYTRPVVAPPAGSEVVEDWRFFYDVGREMGLQLAINRPNREPVPLDMKTAPTTDELLDILAEGSRVPLQVVRQAEGGALYPTPECRVQPADPETAGRADVGNEMMMSELLATPSVEIQADPQFDLRLIPRRVQHVFNSSSHHPDTARGGSVNRAYVNPEDAAERSLADGDEVLVRSPLGELTTILGLDRRLRRGVVSMTHSYGGLPDDRRSDRPAGANLGLIVGLDRLQPHTGQPVMSNIPVSVAGAPSDELTGYN
ncbi:molybdopterin-containing oxidoreductase family protein [Gordonia sp. DT30]|uniref:molybdopterin-containing oxidoreductase family protein n=1 Tax=Gordonia sp. DT30 TaxID=3416546 RepID=UPI003CED99E8